MCLPGKLYYEYKYAGLRSYDYNHLAKDTKYNMEDPWKWIQYLFLIPCNLILDLMFITQMLEWMAMYMIIMRQKDKDADDLISRVSEGKGTSELETHKTSKSFSISKVSLKEAEILLCKVFILIIALYIGIFLGYTFYESFATPTLNHYFCVSYRSVAACSALF